LGEAEAGEEIVITRHGKPVAVLSPYRPPALTPERREAIERAFALMDNAPVLGTARRFTREEMHER
jgi:antitoxin (DNA-binding transcriptional repressor) of toxin-antitoxin stability system